MSAALLALASDLNKIWDQTLTLDTTLVNMKRGFFVSRLEISSRLHNKYAPNSATNSSFG